MRLLREDGVVVCTHELGKVGLRAGQDVVWIEGKRPLIRDDPERRPIGGCPNATPVTKPCTVTLAAETGYSTFVRIDGAPVCLETLRGRTDGQGGLYEYKVNDPGQSLVNEG